MDINDMRQQRAELREAARSLNEAALRDGRDLTDDEQTQWDEAVERIETLTRTITRLDTQARIDESTREERAPRTGNGPVAPAPFERVPEILQRRVGAPTDAPLPNNGAYDDAFGQYLRFGINGMTREARQVFEPHFSLTGGETRAMATSPASAGGALIPQDFYNQLTEALKAYGGVQQAGATIVNTSSGAPMPVPMVDDTTNIGALLTENTAAAEQDFTFAQKTLNSYVYSSKLVRVSLQMLQDSAFDVGTYLSRALATRIGRIVNSQFTTGTGTSQPEGVVTAAASGKVGTTGQTTTVILQDLDDLIHSVDPSFRANARFMMHDSTLKVIEGFKDTQNRPLFAPDMNVPSANRTIRGYPITINQDMAVMAANAKSILFGDFSYYLIRNVLDVRVLRLEERYAEFLQVAFLAFIRTDGLLANPGGTNNPIKYYANSAT